MGFVALGLVIGVAVGFLLGRSDTSFTNGFPTGPGRRRSTSPSVPTGWTSDRKVAVWRPGSTPAEDAILLLTTNGTGYAELIPAAVDVIDFVWHPTNAAAYAWLAQADDGTITLARSDSDGSRDVGAVATGTDLVAFGDFGFALAGSGSTAVLDPGGASIGEHPGLAVAALDDNRLVMSVPDPPRVLHPGPGHRGEGSAALGTGRFISRGVVVVAPANPSRSPFDRCRRHQHAVMVR